MPPAERLFREPTRPKRLPPGPYAATWANVGASVPKPKSFPAPTAFAPPLCPGRLGWLGRALGAPARRPPAVPGLWPAFVRLSLSPMTFLWR